MATLKGLATGLGKPITGWPGIWRWKGAGGSVLGLTNLFVPEDISKQLSPGLFILPIGYLEKTDGEGIYQTENLQEAGFSSSSLMARAVDSLEEKELIAKNGTYQIQDVMLKKWIRSIS